MGSARILIAMSNDASMNKLKTILVENGYLVIEQAREGNECLRKTKTLRPDIVLLDYNLSLLNGFEVAKEIVNDRHSDVILISASATCSEIDSLKDECNFVCMVKPLNKSLLLNIIELMLKNRKKLRELEQEIEELRANLNTRKEVEKAKGLLMKYLNLTEPEAFKRIQKQSMDRGMPMKEIAKAIILAYDI